MSKRKKLPKGWRWAKLGKVCDSIGGGTPSRKIEAYFEGEVPWLTVKDLQEGEYEIDDSSEHITEEAIAQSSTNLISPNSVIVATRVGLGKVAVNSRPVAINQDLRALLPHNGLHPDYLAFAILNTFFSILKYKQGTTVKGITKDDFLSIEIPLPPLAVQERIVEILQQADTIRRKRAEARRLADQILPALFLDMFGDPATNPKGWPVEPIGNMLAPEIERVNPSKACPDEEFTYIEIAHVDNIQFRIVKPKRLLGRNAPSRARQVVRTGDVLYSMTRPNLRNIAVVPEELNGAIATTGFAILRPKQIDDTAFVFEMVKNPVFTNAMARFAEAKSLYPAVDETEIRRYKIMTPPHGLRAQFAKNYEFLSGLDTNTRQGNGASGSLFSVLLSRAFTGELTEEWETENADWIAERQAFYERLPRLALLTVTQRRSSPR